MVDPTRATNVWTDSQTYLQGPLLLLLLLQVYFSVFSLLFAFSGWT